MKVTRLSQALFYALHIPRKTGILASGRVVPFGEKVAISRLQRVLLGALPLYCSLPILSQAVNSSLSGIVQDSSGAVISGAQITATNVETNVSVTSTSGGSGEFVLLNLPAAQYRLTVTANGFATSIQTGISLDVGQKAVQNVTLQAGSMASTVTVKADNDEVSVEDATLSSVVDGTQIRDLPLNSRNPYSLLALTPGFSGSVGNNYNSIGFGMNGARTGYTDVLVDGIPGGFPTPNGNSGVSVFPSVDAINQFRVLAQNFPAEYGNTLGGILNTAFKSGTNSFHGTLYEFARNSALDANDYFSNRNKKALPSLQRNQFGGVLSGPLQHDKMFFLVSAELLRQNSAITTTTTVPTLQQRQGNFSQTFTSSGALVKIYDPFTTRRNPNGTGYVRDQFAGNIIPQTRMSTVARNVMNFYPEPNIAGSPLTQTNNYFAQTTEDSRIDSWDVRVDRTLGHNQTLFGRYSDRFWDDNPQPFFPSALAKAENRTEQRDWMRNFVVGYTIAPTSNLLYDVRLGFSRALYDYLNAGLGFQASTLGLPNSLNNGGGLPVFPVFAASNYVQLGNADNRHSAFMTYSLLQSISWVHGRHTVKAGLDARMIRNNTRETRNTSGSFNFASDFTQGPDPNTASVAAGNSIASLLMGTGTGDLTRNFKDVASQSFYYGIYLQDDWRVTPKLTLSMGMRYDIGTPRTERYNRINYWDPNAASPLSAASGITDLKGGLVFVGVNGRNRHQFDYELNNFAPRVGLAYALDSKTVVHAGFGIVYAPSPQAAQGTVGPFGFRVVNSWVGSVDGITPYNTLDNPFPGGFSPAPGAAAGLATGVGGQIQAFVRNTMTPYTEQYSINIDRELPWSAHLQIGYAGNHALKLQQSREGGIDFDQLPTSALALGSRLNDLVDNPFYGVITTGTLAARQVSRAQLMRPYPQFTSIQPLFLPGAQTRYDGMQVVFEKRMGHGLQVNASYVFAKSYDSNVSHQDSYNPMADYAVSSNSSPHRIVAGYIYELPVGRGRYFGSHMGRTLDALIGGWQVNGITTIQSGTPLQITASNVSGLGNPMEYANWDGTNPTLSGDIHNRLTRYFNISAFSQPAAYTLGNAPSRISTLYSPRLVTTDFSLFKEFHPYREMAVQLRAESFNAFNHVQFGSPNTSVNSSSFGQITSQANAPRQMQFGAKLLF